MKTALLNVLALAVVGCAAGAPPGFSDGDLWSAPLVGPLENGALVVPVKINDKGPYLFIIDPDSPVTSIDSAIASELDLYTSMGERIPDESDVRRQTSLAEVKKIEVGTLSVRSRTVRMHKPGTFWFGGRLIRGLLGRDVIADSLILSVDRDRGLVHLGTQGHLNPPPDAIALSARHFFGRFITKATLNKTKSLDLHIDLGAPWTMLWESRIAEAKLPRVRIRATLTDELGTSREVDSAAIVAKLELGAATGNGLMALPFGDKRLRERDLDGALGQNFLSQYAVTLNWHEKRMWLVPRTSDLGATAAERLRRWGASFDKCATPACVTVTIQGAAPAAEPAEPAPEEPATPDVAADPAAGDAASGEAVAADPAAGETEAPAPAAAPAPAQPFGLQIAREEWTRDLTYDVVLEALGPEGVPLGLPLVRVTFPAGALSVDLAAGFEAYQGVASFRAVDLSPFPRECESGGAGAICAWQLPRAR